MNIKARIVANTMDGGGWREMDVFTDAETAVMETLRSEHHAFTLAELADATGLDLLDVIDAYEALDSVGLLRHAISESVLLVTAYVDKLVPL